MPATDRSADLAAVREGIAATNRGDLDAVLERFDPEVELHIAPGRGNAGTYRGHDGCREGFGVWVDAFNQFKVKEFDLEPVGERHVVVDARQSGRGHGSGIKVELRLGYMVEMRLGNMFELRHGRVVRFHVLPEREAAIAAAEAGEGGAG